MSADSRQPLALALALALAIAVATILAVLEAHAGVRIPDPLGVRDLILEEKLRAIARDLDIDALAADGRASLALVDLTPSGTARYAGIAADTTLGAASMAKLGILVAAFAAAESGKIELTPQLRQILERMIQSSSNPDATRAIELLGLPRIAATLEDPILALHDSTTGGVWVGKNYTGGKIWRVEPCSREAHAASAARVARLYALLDRGELVGRTASTAMRDLLAVTTYDHKFVRGLREAAGAAAPAAGQPVLIPGYTLLRKSGTYGPWQSDSALIETNGRRYILVCLLHDKNGGEAKLRRLAAAVDRMMARRHPVDGPGP
jgi:hypothetical protein